MNQPASQPIPDEVEAIVADILNGTPGDPAYEFKCSGGSRIRVRKGRANHAAFTAFRPYIFSANVFFLISEVIWSSVSESRKTTRSPEGLTWA